MHGCVLMFFVSALTTDRATIASGLDPGALSNDAHKAGHDQTLMLDSVWLVPFSWGGILEHVLYTDTSFLQLTP